MNANHTRSTPAAAEQTLHTTIGWIGHLPGEREIVGRGQTFIANTEGELQSIELYSNVVTDPGQVLMTVHHYDPARKTWGPAIASTTVQFDKQDSGKWVTFNIAGLHLDKGKTYGFKVATKESLIGIGEAIGSASQPLLTTGQEWKFSGNDNNGDAFSYFSLAFKVGIRA